MAHLGLQLAVANGKNMYSVMISIHPVLNERGVSERRQATRAD